MAKKVNLKKNKKSYDSKIITWISVGLAAFVAIVVAIVLIINITTGYVAKVDGLKIYDHEYLYFLQNAMYTEQQENFEEPDGYDDMTSEEQQAVIREFWTDERKNSCAATALEDARQFKAQYRLAVKAGYKLTSDEKNNVKNYITNMYNSYKTYYGYTEELIESYFLGGMSLSDYKDFMLMQTAIDKYKSAIKEKYDPSDDELRAIYDENPDDYRKIGIRNFQINIDAKKPTDTEADDYQTKLDEYNKARDEALEYAKEIMDTYNSGKLMSVYQKDDDGNYLLDSDGNRIPDKTKMNLTFEEYIKNESDAANSSTNGGLLSINNLNKAAVDELTEYALSMVWNEDRTLIVKKDQDENTDNAEDTPDEASEEPEDSDSDNNSDNNEEDNEEDSEKKDSGTDEMTKLEIIETDTAIYVVRAETITDFDNSKESSEGAKDSIKDNIKAEYLEDKAVEELEKMVNDQGSKYSITGKKSEEIEELNNQIFSTI